MAGAQRGGQSLPPTEFPRSARPAPAPDALFSSGCQARPPQVPAAPGDGGSSGSGYREHGVPLGPRPGLDGPGEGRRTREHPPPCPPSQGRWAWGLQQGPLPTGWELSAFNTDPPGRPRGRHGHGGVSDTVWPARNHQHAPPPPGPSSGPYRAGWGLGEPPFAREMARQTDLGGAGAPFLISRPLCPTLSAPRGLWGPL